MDTATRQSEAATIVDVTGRVTLDNAPNFLKALMDLLKVERAPRVIVNMTNLSYIDSAGIACLVEALKVAHESNLRLALFGLNREVKDVLELTRLSAVFEVYGTEEDALRGVGSARSGTKD
jgi:anti-sigma B factor antagonist